MKDITLNDLLAISDADNLRLRVPMTARLVATMDVDATDGAVLSDIVEAYGDRLVKSITASGEYNGTLLVELKR